MKGVLALDIDGTLTANHHSLDAEVVQYLTFLAHQGWVLIFITGRTFIWGYEVLKSLNFPYFFAVHNGVSIFKMPSKQIVARTLLTSDLLPKIDMIFENLETDYIIYQEGLNGPVCYYRPDCLPDFLFDYLQKRAAAFKESWQPLKTFDDLPVQKFSALKYFGYKEEAEEVAKQLIWASLHAPIIKDPYDKNYYIIQATHPDVTKGHALRRLLSILDASQVPAIAAGDDNNDATMLSCADVKVVMETAPEELLNMADIIAPPAKEKGIIVGLKKAILLIEKRNYNVIRP